MVALTRQMNIRCCQRIAKAYFLTQSLPLDIKLQNKVDLALAEIERGKIEEFQVTYSK